LKSFLHEQLRSDAKKIRRVYRLGHLTARRRRRNGNDKGKKMAIENDKPGERGKIERRIDEMRKSMVKREERGQYHIYIMCFFASDFGLSAHKRSKPITNLLPFTVPAN